MDIKSIFAKIGAKAAWPFQQIDKEVGEAVAEKVTIGAHAALLVLSQELPVIAAMSAGKTIKFEGTIRLVVVE